MITRRRFIVTAAAGAAGLSAAGRLWAATGLDLGGGVRIDTVSDGHLVLPREFMFGESPSPEVAAILERHGVEGDMIERPCNLTLLRDGERTVLFDAGSGPTFMESAGRIAEGLSAIGVDPSDVTDVVFTHGHPDHLWGVQDDFGDLAFPEAAHYFPRPEWDYWMQEGLLDDTPEARKSFVVGAQNRLPEIEDVTELFDAGQEVLPGVMAHATHGHTQGHMSFEIRRGSESVMVVGDALADGHLAFEMPQAPAGADHEPERAAATRAKLLDQLATDQMTLIGFHLAEPGVGRAERKGDAYRFVHAEEG
ncbi:MAG: MBL fold metallo-hydrolase [Pseudomonadota bacterium]